MVLQDPEEISDIVVEVIDHLGARPEVAAEEHAAHTDKGLGIAFVRRGVDQRDQALCEYPLAAQIGRRRPARLDR